jgi:3-oxoadipate enol-lactonase
MPRSLCVRAVGAVCVSLRLLLLLLLPCPCLCSSAAAVRRLTQIVSSGRSLSMTAGTTYDPRLRLQGSGPPLIFVPGMDGTGRLFYKQVPILTRQFRVGTYALRDDAESMETLVEDLDQVMRTLAPNGERVVVVTESFGGAPALSYALAHPERIRGLVVLNSFPRFPSQLRLRVGLGLAHVVPWRLMAVFRRATVSRLHSRTTDRSEVRHFLRQTDETTRRGYISRLRILMKYDVRDRLKDIRVPTLFLAADQDQLVASLEHASYMVSRVPGATLRILEGHGHACLIAPGVDLAEILGEWLG